LVPLRNEAHHKDFLIISSVLFLSNENLREITEAHHPARAVRGERNPAPVRPISDDTRPGASTSTPSQSNAASGAGCAAGPFPPGLSPNDARQRRSHRCS